jgi:hypothetical protein
MELTYRQIERQDFVDNAVFELLQTVIPNGKKLDWDIEIIADVRDMIRMHFVGKKFCTGQELYPYIEE